MLALIATQIDGRSEIRGVQELRVKETDRIATTVQELTKLGAHIEELPDGFVINDRTALRGAVVSGHGDHRIAMMLAVAGMAAEGETVVEGAECEPSPAGVRGDDACGGGVDCRRVSAMQ